MKSIRKVSIALSLITVLIAASCSGSANSGDSVFGNTRSDGESVMVELTPEKYSDGQLVIDIRVTTHTVSDLDRYDLRAITLLKASGISVSPVSAPQMQGHHNRGKLVFAVTALPATFQIEIRGLPGKDLMTFSWP